MTRRDALDIVASLTGAILIAAALILIWVARFEFGGTDVYVSELGGTGAPTPDCDEQSERYHGSRG